MTQKVITTVKPDGSVEKTTKEDTMTSKKPFTFIYKDYGVYLITPIIIGVLGGVYLDKYFHTKPLFTISLLILGIIGTFYNLMKIVKDDNATR